MNKEAIKTQGKQIGLITAGFMGANLVSKVAPLKNEKIKSIIPLALGIAVTMASKNKNVQVIGAGAASFGLLKTVRTLLAGSDPTGANGIEGLADNPAVKKVLDMLIPNLGSIDNIEDADVVSYETYFEPAIVDVPYADTPIQRLPKPSPETTMEGITDPIVEESLLGTEYDYDNELYL